MAKADDLVITIQLDENLIKTVAERLSKEILFEGVPMPIPSVPPVGLLGGESSRARASRKARKEASSASSKFSVLVVRSGSAPKLLEVENGRDRLLVIAEESSTFSLDPSLDPDSPIVPTRGHVIEVRPTGFFTSYRDTGIVEVWAVPSDVVAIRNARESRRGIKLKTGAPVIAPTRAIKLRTK